MCHNGDNLDLAIRQKPEENVLQEKNSDLIMLRVITAFCCVRSFSRSLGECVSADCFADEESHKLLIKSLEVACLSGDRRPTQDRLTNETIPPYFFSVPRPNSSNAENSLVHSSYCSDFKEFLFN